jgi:hypothetical protein
LPAFFVSAPGALSPSNSAPELCRGSFLPPRPMATPDWPPEPEQRAVAGCDGNGAMAPLACATVAHPGPSVIQTRRDVLVPLSGSSSITIASKGCSSALGLTRGATAGRPATARKKSPRDVTRGAKFGVGETRTAADRGADAASRRSPPRALIWINSNIRSSATQTTLLWPLVAADLHRVIVPEAWGYAHMQGLTLDKVFVERGSRDQSRCRIVRRALRCWPP